MAGFKGWQLTQPAALEPLLRALDLVTSPPQMAAQLVSGFRVLV